MTSAAMKLRVRRLKRSLDTIEDPARVFVLLPGMPVPDDFFEPQGDRIVSVEILGEEPRDFGAIDAVTRVVFQVPQFEAMFCEEDDAAYVGGLGSGKSWALARACLAVMHWEIDSIHMACMANLEHARDVVIPELDRALRDFGYVEDKHYWWRQKEGGGRPTLKIRIRGKVVQLRIRGTDNKKRLRGPEVASLFIDERRDCDPEGLKVASERARCPLASRIWRRASTTPNGWDDTWSRYVEDFDDREQKTVMAGAVPVPVSTYRKAITIHVKDPRTGKKKAVRRTRALVNCSTKANVFAKEGYYEEILEDNDDQRAKQEAEGEFVAPSTVVASSFDRMLNCPSEGVVYDPDLDAHIGQDFNVARNASVLAHIVPVVPSAETGDARFEVRIFAELKCHNTEDTAKAIARLLKGHRARILCWPDPAGSQRSTTSRTTDHQLLKDLVPGLVLKKVPDFSVVDSVAHMNSKFKNAYGFRAIQIDKACSELLKDCGQVEWEKGREQIKKHSSGPGAERSHWLDALRYLVWGAVPRKSRKVDGRKGRIRG